MALAAAPDAAHHSPATAGTVALVGPDVGPDVESEEWQATLRHQGQPYVLVTLPAEALARGAVGDRAPSVVHRGLRSTARCLHAHKVTAIVPGSARGVELADQLAEQLGLPGNDPSTSELRRDRGAQAAAWARAGLPSARTQPTTSLPAALRWARFVALPELVVSPADTAVCVPARVCRAHTDLGLAWTHMRRAAHHRGGSRQVVLQERVPGRQYTVRATTADGQHTVTEIWSLTHTPEGLLDRSDLQPDSGLLHRSLSHLAGQALTALGVRHGAMRIRMAYHPERGPVLLSARCDVTPTHPRPTTRLHTTRVALNAPADGVLNRRLLRALLALPTVNQITGDLHPGAVVTQTTNRNTSPGQIELVGGPAAVETDYQAIRRFEARGLYAQFGEAL
ncbi:hypothetical protein [Streptomyces sp. NPDC004296]|uniref:hypothetical protein n=1 Tax=Streptomyces sp. NPDC004296 TaxID=3364697 RepID=UPI0036A40E20